MQPPQSRERISVFPRPGRPEPRGMPSEAKAWLLGQASGHGVVEDSPMVNDEPSATSAPLTIWSTCVALAVALV